MAGDVRRRPQQTECYFEDYHMLIEIFASITGFLITSKQVNMRWEEKINGKEN